MKKPGPAMLVALVLSTVAIQLLVAALLKEASQRSAVPAWIAFAIVAAIVLNGARFVIWGHIHRYYPLSHSYPISAMFFPLVVAMAWAYGERVTGMNIAGAVLITAGVVLCLLGNPGEAPDP